MTRASKPPPKEAVIVVTVALAANLHLFPVTPNVLDRFESHLRLQRGPKSSPLYLPELKANQPHHNMKRPMRALVGLPMGGGASRSQRPSLGPNIMAATTAKIRTNERKRLPCFMCADGVT